MDFQAIYEAHQPKIRRYLARMVGEAEADDLTQEVFVKVNRALADFREESSLSTWIYRIATNTALDRLRAARPEPASDLDEEAEMAEKTPSAEQQLVHKEMNECLQGYIDRLPEIYRTVLILSELEELKNQETADILGISLGAVKIRLFRARELLRNALICGCDPQWVEENEFLPNLNNALGRPPYFKED